VEQAVTDEITWMFLQRLVPSHFEKCVPLCYPGDTFSQGLLRFSHPQKEGSARIDTYERLLCVKKCSQSWTEALCVVEDVIATQANDKKKLSQII